MTPRYSVALAVNMIKTVYRNLSNLVQWSEEWQVLFNIDKCKAMHFGKTYITQDYSIHGLQLEVVNKESDLGVLIVDDLKVSQQCQQACNKAAKALGIINRTIEYRDPVIFLRLYKSLVIPHLEYCVSAWYPHYTKDKMLLEKILRRFTRVIPDIRHLGLPYEVRLSKLGLWTLEDRRVRSDLVQVFKIVHGLSPIKFGTFFEIRQYDRTRGHSLKLHKSRVQTDLRQHFFTERIINIWNSLDEYHFCYVSEQL